MSELNMGSGVPKPNSESSESYVVEKQYLEGMMQSDKDAANILVDVIMILAKKGISVEASVLEDLFSALDTNLLKRDGQNVGARSKEDLDKDVLKLLKKLNLF